MSIEHSDVEIHKKWTNKEGELHREDGPALILKSGTEKWYLNGTLHREGGPAVSTSEGVDYWFCNGKLHRLDGPAMYNHVTKTGVWYNHGVVHRIGGPAWESPTEKKWYQEGVMHRIDGPAYTNKLLPQNNLYYYKGSLKSKEDWFKSMTDKEKVEYLFSMSME